VYVNTKFHEDRVRQSSNIKNITSTICEAVVLILITGEIMNFTIEMASCRKPGFMKISREVQAILRSCFNSAAGCNARVTKRRDLHVLSILLRLLHML
jgi:hypothetical protein